MAKSDFVYQFSTQRNGITRLVQLGKAWQEDFPKSFDQESVHIRAVIRELVRRKPGVAVHPIFWAPSTHPEDANKKPNTRWGFYSRQKTAFWLSHGFGKGIPSPRTGTITRGWQVRNRVSKNRVTIEVSNNAPEFKFVQGDAMQPMHIVSGWLPIENLIDDVQKYLDDAIPIAMDMAMERFFD